MTQILLRRCYGTTIHFHLYGLDRPYGGQILQITPMGIIITDDDTTDNVEEELQTGNPSGYGYVSTPDSSSKGTLESTPRAMQLFNGRT